MIPRYKLVGLHGDLEPFASHSSSGEWVKYVDYLSEQDGLSWFVQDSLCKACGYKVVITQSKLQDYFWYCSNKYCENHAGVELGDQDQPGWVTE